MKNASYWTSLAVVSVALGAVGCSKEEGDRMEQRIDRTAENTRENLNEAGEKIETGARDVKDRAKTASNELGNEIDKAVNRFTTPDRNDVRRAQMRLSELGYDPGSTDGIVGPNTQAAIERFQRAENLEVTGELDTGTVGRLEARVPQLAE